MPTPTDIKNRLLADPNKVGYAAHISAAEGGTAAYTMDGDLERLGNSPNSALSVPLSLPMSDVLQASAGAIYAAVYAYSQTGTVAAVKGLCLAALRLFDVGGNLDFSNPNINGSSGMFQQLQAAGVIDSTQLAALIAAGTKTPCSDFEQAFGAGAYINHRQLAQALGRGNGQ